MTEKCLDIVILNFPGALPSAVLGIHEILSHGLSASGAVFNIHTLSNECETGESIDCVIVPPSSDEVDKSKAPWISGWLAQQHKQGALICSVCVGLIWLLESGIIQNRQVTTHWAVANRLEEHPGVCLDVDRMLIEYPDLITAGGLMAWVDLCLALINRFVGQEVAAATARHFVVDFYRQNQRLYARFVPNLSHGDQSILRVQNMIASKFATKIQNTELADISGMSMRSFLRRFKSTTGYTPLEYTQQVRIESARNLLIHSQLSIGEIAFQVGYADHSSFGRLFQKNGGESPKTFRERHRRSGLGNESG